MISMIQRMILSVLFYMVLAVGTQAQDWKTVPANDTLYYHSDKLRAIRVTDATETNGDSLFTFYKTLRMENGCFDTLAPSWLGDHFLRKPDGTEYYFNSFSDTITIRTQATLNESWTIVSDTSGIEFRGTVSAIRTDTIDQVADSVKTVHIQAYRNGSAQPHHYNQFVLELSKNHGWFKVLDFYCFPNRQKLLGLSYWTNPDSTQHYRMDRQFTAYPLDFVDPAWKYASGNEWIMENTVDNRPLSYSRSVIHDSVLSFVHIDAGRIAVDFYTRDFYESNNGISTRSFYHTDTIEYVPVEKHIRDILPEFKFTIFNWSQGDEVYNAAYFVAPYCFGRYLIEKRGNTAENIGEYNGCIELKHNISQTGGEFVRKYLPGFGSLDKGRQTGFDDSPSAASIGTKYTYLNLPGCIQGTKIDVLRLGVAALANPAESGITVYPNPARNRLYVRFEESGFGAGQLTLINMAGQVLQTSYTDGIGSRIIEMPLDGIAAGIYCIRFSSAGGVVNKKVTITGKIGE